MITPLRFQRTFPTRSLHEKQRDGQNERKGYVTRVDSRKSQEDSS